MNAHDDQATTSARPDKDPRGRTRRLLAGVVLGFGAILAVSSPANAAVTATFSPGSGVLTVIGDNLDNSTTISRDASGKMLVNGGAVAVLGGTPTVANTTLISVFGLGGNDTLSLNEVNGALPRANLFGGAGNDTLIGGAGADQVFGQSGNDRMVWNPGDDTDLNEGGDGTDTVEVNGGNGTEQFTTT